MNKVPQVTRRRIGQVTIIDVKGELVGPWAAKVKENLGALIRKHATDNLLINLRDLVTVDSLGVKAILESFPGHSKSALISGRISVMEMFSHLTHFETIKIFSTEEEVVQHFGRELVSESQVVTLTEQRRAIRLKTAIPLEFWYETHQGEKITLTAIITDLSESGLFAEYLDIESLSDFTKYLNPQEMNLLHLKIKLPDRHAHLFLDGQVSRTMITGEQVGIGVRFINSREDDVEAIRSFLKN